MPLYTATFPAHGPPLPPLSQGQARPLTMSNMTFGQLQHAAVITISPLRTGEPAGSHC